MRKVTAYVVGSFMNRMAATSGNTSTDGTVLLLHGNKIAEHRKDGTYVSLAGWNTVTTRERLNAIPGVSLTQRGFKPYLNGQLIADTTAWFRV